MGNGPSNRRNGRIQHNSLVPAPPPRVAPTPPGYPPSHAPHHGPPFYPPNGHQAPYFYPPNGALTGGLPPPFFPHGYLPQSNGQFMMNYQQQQQPQQFRPVTHNPSPPQHNTPAVAETQKANTIRNDVNLKKATLRLEKDEENKDCHLVAFSFDANVAGWISISFLAKEKEQCAFSPLIPSAYKARKVRFEKGLVQKFQQASGSGVNLAMFDERDLSKEGEDDVYPLVVRTETLGKDVPAGFELKDLEDLPIDAPVPKYVHCQTTQAVIEKKEDGDYKVRVIRQNIWVDGVQYELQEIYGIENSAGGGGGFDTNDAGKECVICMSEPRDTTVLPCRHMCMCSECAKVLRFQTNRCPICRTPVERFLEIKVPKTDADNSDFMSATDASGASASQSSPHPDAGQSSASSPGASARKDEAKVSRGSTQDGESVM